MKKRPVFTSLLSSSLLLGALGAPALAASHPESVKSQSRFNTADAMYLANEEIKVFSCGLPYKSLGSTINTDSYWYSLYNMGNLVMRSGMGIHMVHAPVGQQMSKMYPERFPTPKDFMIHKMKQFMMRSGLQKMPKNPYPIFLPFASGDPSFTQSPNPFDFSTLRWDPQQFDTTLSPAAIGQMATKQVMWAEDFFSAHRGKLLGRTDLDGFRGGVLTASALNALMTLKDQLAFDGKHFGAVDPMNYDPMKGLHYYPHAIAPQLKAMMPNMPPAPMGYQVRDRSSHLFDQASLLWASSEFYFYSDPKVHDSYDRIFGDEAQGAIFPAKPHMLGKGLSAVLIKNLMAMHQDPQSKVLVSRAGPGKRGHYVDTAESGMLVTALENSVRAFHDAPMLQKSARMMLVQQANFMRDKLQRDDGLFANGYDLHKQAADNQEPQLAAQVNALKALSLAYKSTQDASYLKAAVTGYEALKKHFWHEGKQVFKAQLNDQHKTVLQARTIAATIGGLREFALASKAYESDAVDHMTAFFNHSINKRDGIGGLQLAEMGESGEMMPEDEIDMVKMTLKMKKMMQMPAKKRMEMMMAMRDTDEDGIPMPMFAGGRFGKAPVVTSAIEIQL